MATAELKVRIEAEIANFKKGLDKANGDLNNFSGKVTESLRKTSAEAAKTSAVLGGSIAKNSNQAALGLNNFNRVIQDAPFGIIGIQNNIPPLIESFSALKKSTGSSTEAFKALASNLLGSGGLLFGVSLLSTAFTILAQNPEKVAGVINYLSGVVDNATEIQKAYNQELIETQTSAKVEIASLNGLIAIARNETLSRNARLEALKKVKSEYPEQLKFLSLETIGSKQAADAIDLLSKSILRKAKIQSTEKILGEAFAKQLEATTKTAVEQASTLSKVVGATLGAAGIKNFVVLQNGIENQAKAFKDAQSEIDTYNQLLTKLNTEEAKSGTLFDDTKNAGRSLKTQSDILKELRIDLKAIESQPLTLFGQANSDKINAINSAIKELIKIGAPQTIISKLQQDLLALDISGFKNKGKSLGDNFASGLKNGFATVLPVVSFDLSNKLKTGLNDWQTYVNSELLPKVQGNFETFFNDILMRGKLSFESLGKAILNTFLSIVASDAARGLTNLLSVNTGRQYSDSLGKGKGGGLLGGLIGLLGKGKTAGAAATGTAATGGALLPIIGGIAAVAGIASLFKKRKTEPTPAFTTSNAIASQPAAVGFDTGRVVFEISGVNLVGVLNRAGAKLQRFGP